MDIFGSISNYSVIWSFLIFSLISRAIYKNELHNLSWHISLFFLTSFLRFSNILSLDISSFKFLRASINLCWAINNCWSENSNCCLCTCNFSLNLASSSCSRRSKFVTSSKAWNSYLSVFLFLKTFIFWIN